MNKTNLVIEIINNITTIRLISSGKEIDSVLVDGLKLTDSLLLEIDKIFKKNKSKLIDLKQISIKSDSASYTGQRVAFTVANSLAFGLNIPIDESDLSKTKQTSQITKFIIPVLPKYNREPHITRPKA